MSNNKSVKLYLQDIAESIDLIEEYITNKTQDDFSSDVGLQDKVIRRLEIIGEASKYIPEEYRVKTSHVPWTQITDMRNVLIHEYFGIDFSRVWDVVSGAKLKQLHEAVQKLLKDI